MSRGKTDFVELRERLSRLGFDRRTPHAIFAEWLVFVVVFASGMALAAIGEAWWQKVVALVLISFAGMGFGTNAHTASHHAISRRKWLNDFFLYFGFPFIHQVSASYWRHKHLVMHHPNPNVVGVDADADLAPFFALDRVEYERAKGFQRWWYRHQIYFLPIVLVGNFFLTAGIAWAFLLRRLADPKTRDLAHWLDLLALALHWVVWLIVPALIFGPLDVALFALARSAVMSYVMFALFAPAHYPAGALLLDKTAQGRNFLMLQTLTTINYRTGPIGRLLCGGVEFQIEHHLFPTISPRHYSEMSGHVKAFCDKHGYPYRSERWGRAIWLSVLTFRQPKPIHAGLPAPAASRSVSPAKAEDVAVDAVARR